MNILINNNKNVGISPQFISSLFENVKTIFLNNELAIYLNDEYLAWLSFYTLTVMNDSKWYWIDKYDSIVGGPMYF